MLEAAAGQVAEIWRNRFLELGLSRIEQAVRHKKGARFMEEVLLSAIVEERGTLVNFVPQSNPASSTSRNDDSEPDLDVF